MSNHVINLIAVGMDGNNQIVPIAFGICKGETGSCWSWWMSVLKQCIGDNPNLLFISDRHAAIALALQDEFPLAYYAKAASVKVSRDLSSNGARVVLSTSQTHRFTSPLRRSFVGGLVATIDPVELERFSTNQVKRILTYSLGYDENFTTFLYLSKPNCSLDSGLVPLADALQDRNMLLMDLEAEATLANTMLDNLTRYFEQMRIHEIQITMLQNMPTMSLNSYGIHALLMTHEADIRTTNNLIRARQELLRSIAEKQNFINNYRAI
nr:transposase, MuDR, MULE transposase domain protein [Tanacetum cinerariifolium]